jgi:PilZ domain
MSIENRRHPRRVVQQYVRIVYPNGPTCLFGTMLDVSGSGARLRLNDTAELPSEFTLMLSRDGKVRRRCHLVWRREDLVGIKFI